MKEVVRLCILVACVMSVTCVVYWLHVTITYIGYMCLCVYDYTGFLVAN